jgi:hypothetical protein
MLTRYGVGSPSKLSARPAVNDGDAPYSRDQLLAMNQRFIDAVERRRGWTSKT